MPQIDWSKLPDPERRRAAPQVDTVRVSMSNEEKPDPPSLDLSALPDRMTDEEYQKNPTVSEVWNRVTPGGAAWNAATSLGNVVKNTLYDAPLAALKLGATGVKAQFFASPEEKLRMANDALATIKQLPAAAYDALAQRYGGKGNIAKTVYEDPFGVLSDLSVLTGGVGLAAKAGGFAKTAKVANALSRVDAADAAVRVGAKGADKAANLAIRATLKPGKKLAEGFQTTVPEIVNRVKTSDLTSFDAADTAALKAGEANLAMAREMNAAGHPGGSWQEFTEAIEKGPAASEAGRQQRTGDLGKKQKKVAKEVADLREQHIIKDPATGAPVVPEQWAKFPIDEVFESRRDWQKVAYNKGGAGKDYASRRARAKAANLQQQTEKVAPELAKGSQDTQVLMSIAQAFKDAEARPAAALNLRSQAWEMLRDPGRGAKAGQGLYKGSQFAIDPRTLQTVKAMRAAGASDEQIEAALTRLAVPAPAEP